MGNIKENIDLQRLPRHVAIIMDGNGRWAKRKGNRRIFGHRQALRAVRAVLEGGVEVGLEYITLYTFSTENWKRPKTEVRALMQLLVSTIRKEVDTLMKNNIRLRAIGNLEDLPKRAIRELNTAMEITGGNTGMVLTLALSYGGRADILSAINKIATQVKSGDLEPGAISESDLRSRMSSHFLPDPELMIRTSGEFRISNFLLWELAYAEIYITEKLWPDFTQDDLYGAIVDYQNRERRFGMISEQLNTL
ncbi:MAG TPA: isoprenyl transferase [Bacteroidetes bacterium]|nr:isoprenyl transferase [Bacteroidota bacterium]